MVESTILISFHSTSSSYYFCGHELVARAEVLVLHIVLRVFLFKKQKKWKRQLILFELLSTIKLTQRLFLLAFFLAKT